MVSCAYHLKSVNYCHSRSSECPACFFFRQRLSILLTLLAFTFCDHIMLKTFKRPLPLAAGCAARSKVGYRKLKFFRPFFSCTRLKSLCYSSAVLLLLFDAFNIGRYPQRTASNGDGKSTSVVFHIYSLIEGNQARAAFLSLQVCFALLT